MVAFFNFFVHLTSSIIGNNYIFIEVDNINLKQSVLIICYTDLIISYKNIIPISTHLCVRVFLHLIILNLCYYYYFIALHCTKMILWLCFQWWIFMHITRQFTIEIRTTSYMHIILLLYLYKIISTVVIIIMYTIMITLLVRYF